MLKSLVMALAAGKTRALTRRLRNAAVLNLLAVASILAGIAFLVGAGFIVTARRYGPLEAAIGFGAGFIALAVLLIVVNAVQARAWKRRQEEMQGAEMKALALTALVTALPALLKSKGGLAGVLLPIAGLVALKIYDENRDTDDGDDEN